MSNNFDGVGNARIKVYSLLELHQAKLTALKHAIAVGLERTSVECSYEDFMTDMVKLREEERRRLTFEALADVDAGNVINDQAVQAWSHSLDTEAR